MTPVSYTHLDVYKRQPRFCLYRVKTGGAIRKDILYSTCDRGRTLLVKNFKRFRIRLQNHTLKKTNIKHASYKFILEEKKQEQYFVNHLV